MLLPAVLAWLLAAGTPPSVDPTVQWTGLAALVTAVGTIVVAVLNQARKSRQRETDDASLAEKQRTELLTPTLTELERVRRDRDRALLDRGVLIAVCLQHNVPIPPEVFQ